MARTFFEDLSLDQRIVIGEWPTSKEECVAFARTWEPQPHHIDEDAAAASIYGQLTVCSLYLFGVCTRLFFDYDAPLAVLAMLGKSEIRLPGPAHPGDRLVYATRCTEKRESRSRPEAGIVTLDDELTTDSGQLVLSQKVQLLIAKKAVGARSDG